MYVNLNSSVAYFLLKLIHSIFYYLQTLIILIKVYYENVHTQHSKKNIFINMLHGYNRLKLKNKIFSLLCDNFKSDSNLFIRITCKQS